MTLSDGESYKKPKNDNIQSQTAKVWRPRKCDPIPSQKRK